MRKRIYLWLLVAANVCIDSLEQRPRRSLPEALGDPSDPERADLSSRLDPIWLEPFPDELLSGQEGAPEARYDARASITLAFLLALQLLPPRQHAVLILREVLDWHAKEVARLLEVRVPALQGLLHWANAAIVRRNLPERRERFHDPLAEDRVRNLLDRYVKAWEEADVERLASLLKEDAAFPMPPFPACFKGRSVVPSFLSAAMFAGNARGRWRLEFTRASGSPGFGCCLRQERGWRLKAFALQVIEIEGDRPARFTTFGDPGLFRFFGLPAELPDRMRVRSGERWR
ncbi:MAG: RNA polymerase subunit sigma-70 [Anaerolineales bacterium]|jgi:RNA polymerase sigma-70 factor (ECF subfamily)